MLFDRRIKRRAVGPVSKLKRGIAEVCDQL
jgi:hypothetical protein